MPSSAYFQSLRPFHCSMLASLHLEADREGRTEEAFAFNTKGQLVRMKISRPFARVGRCILVYSQLRKRARGERQRVRPFAVGAMEQAGPFLVPLLYRNRLLRPAFPAPWHGRPLALGRQINLLLAVG